MTKKFVVGDIVQLKSGGPGMAVSDYDEERQRCKCQWFAGKKLEQGIFPTDSLEKVEKPSS